ncbi:MAG TPA: serine/threonine-protein kinase [Terriglobales bacterium]|nr:serine/threonine-protein kinase [Terriglobales bacterium]
MSRPSAQELSRVNSPQAGDKLDHYRIEDMVARTNMTTIFRGTDLRTGYPVAIKVPHFEVESDPVFFDRFRREQEIGRKLDHPRVIKMMADGEQSRLYIAMEWLEGKLLRKILNEQEKLPVERAIKITIGICQALEHIHQQEIVHRDLKPENIMVDTEDNIKLIDFGIAGAAGTRRLTFGRMSHTMGTPDYISPEQVRRKRGDARSDIYALGVMLYEMLTGKVPFQGPSSLAIMNDRLLNNPVPPREVNSEIRPALQEVIYRALERDPKNRYANAREFAWDLQHLDQVGIAERSELQDWKQRRLRKPKAVLFYVMLAIIPIVILVLMFSLARHP